MNGGRRSFCSSQAELADFFTCSGVKVVSVDMPPFMHIRAVDFARKTHDSLEKFTSKTLALSLKKASLGFDEISLSGAFSACAVINGRLEGIQVHGLAAKTPFQSNVCVANAILDMYGKCGALVEARCVFDKMETRDAVSWNAIIAACEQNKNEEETLLLFAWMLQSRMEPDEFTYGSVVKACAGRQALNSGREIHGRVIKSGMGLDTFVGIVLVDMYCKCSAMEDAEKLHHRIEEQTTVSWNAIMFAHLYMISSIVCTL